MNKENSKTSRASQSREKTERKKHWTPPSYLDTPNAPNGFRHRWVRVEIMGYSDTKNVQGRLREGYELVRADQYPNDDYPVISDGKYKGVIGHGGLADDDLIAVGNMDYATLSDLEEIKDVEDGSLDYGAGGEYGEEDDWS